VNSSSPWSIDERPEAPTRLGYGAMGTFRANPAGFLTEAVNNYVLTAHGNWSVPFQHPFFAAPVAIAFADGDSEEFLDIKKKYPWTLTPRECLENPPRVHAETVTRQPKSRVDMPAAGHIPLIGEDGHLTWPTGEPPLPPWKGPGSTGVDRGAIGESYGGPPPSKEPPAGPPPPPRPERVTVMSIGLPIHPATLEAEASYPWGNSPELKVHSLLGAHLGFTIDVTNYVVKTLQMLGCLAISPYHTTWGSEFQMDFQYEGPTSRQPISPCPERDWAVAAGLGTWGLSDMIITERGMAVILASIVTSAEIPASGRPTTEYCLFFRDGSCRECVPRCPGQAISTDLDPPGRLSARCEAGARAGVMFNETYLKERMLTELGEYAFSSGNLIWEGSGLGMPVISFLACGRCYTDVPCSTRIPG
jgi:hypothetical protein